MKPLKWAAVLFDIPPLRRTLPVRMRTGSTMNVVMDVLVVCLVFLVGPFVAIHNAEIEIPHIE